MTSTRILPASARSHRAGLAALRASWGLAQGRPRGYTLTDLLASLALVAVLAAAFAIE